ncbi:hypothetical protein [Streptomyces sp. NPDC005732]|uniref:hypothetical protein n=1 Tax=Streptomyces sp. NPDC005732 TaxID=3157057 RepID=UPI0033FA3D9C
MTTAPPVTVDWIRFTIDGDEFTLSPSPDFVLHVTVIHGGRGGPALGYCLAVHLIPLREQDFAAVARCETRAREVAARLGVGKAVRHNFALEAGLDGEDLPHNRLDVPCLQVTSVDPPEFDDDEPLPSVRVFTAKMVAAADGAAYRMRKVG